MAIDESLAVRVANEVRRAMSPTATSKAKPADVIRNARELGIKSQRAQNDHVLVSVSDAGVGLPPEHEDQIFKAFFTTKGQGTGMGLSISRSIVEAHGGQVWAADNSPRGATFYINLPTKAEEDV